MLCARVRGPGLCASSPQSVIVRWLSETRERRRSLLALVLRFSSPIFRSQAAPVDAAARICIVCVTAGRLIAMTLFPV